MSVGAESEYLSCAGGAEIWPWAICSLYCCGADFCPVHLSIFFPHWWADPEFTEISLNHFVSSPNFNFPQDSGQGHPKLTSLPENPFLALLNLPRSGCSPPNLKPPIDFISWYQFHQGRRDPAMGERKRLPCAIPFREASTARKLVFWILKVTFLHVCQTFPHWGQREDKTIVACQPFLLISDVLEPR